MKTSVCLPWELGSSELERWHAIRAQRPELDNPFLSPGFAVAVSHVRPDARVAVAEDGGKIVAFLPFEKRAVGLAVPIGAGLSDCQAITSEPGFEFEVNDLLEQSGISAWRFDHLLGAQRANVAPNAIEVPSPIIDLSGGFDAYLGDGRHSFHRIFKTERKLAREIGPVRFGFGGSDDTALTILMAWKSEQYRRTGRPDRFATASTVALIRELAGTSEPSLSGTLMTLHAGDRLVAVEFSLRSETVMAGWFPAYDPELRRYSPGSIHMLRTIEAAGMAGLARYDLGKGEEPYKCEFKTGDTTVCEGWAVRPVALGRLRRAMSMPAELAFNVVLGHPALRHAARVTLQRIGTARLALDRRSQP